MTVTTTTHVDTSIQEVWSARVLRSHVRNGFWGRFCGAPGSGMPIVQQSELLNRPGDTLHVQVSNPLSGSGIAGDGGTQVAGNEENLVTSEILVVPTLLRHGVRAYRRASKK